MYVHLCAAIVDYLLSPLNGQSVSRYGQGYEARSAAATDSFEVFHAPRQVVHTSNMPSPPTTLPLSGETLPVQYDREPTYDGMVTERDVYVPMRDGVRLCADIYRPETDDPVPALLAF